MKILPIILFTLLLTAGVFAPPPEPPAAFGDVTEISLCQISCKYNTTDYICNYGDEITVECYAHNATGYRVPRAPFQFEVTGGGSLLFHTEIYSEDALDKSEYTGEVLAPELQHQSGPGGGAVHAFTITNEYLENTPYNFIFYVNQTNGSFPFYVNRTQRESVVMANTTAGAEYKYAFSTYAEDGMECTANLLLRNKHQKTVYRGNGTYHMIVVPTLLWNALEMTSPYNLEVYCGGVLVANRSFFVQFTNNQDDAGKIFGSFVIHWYVYMIGLLAILFSIPLYMIVKFMILPESWRRNLP